jgi:hypothetical protein
VTSIELNARTKPTSDIVAISSGIVGRKLSLPDQRAALTSANASLRPTFARNSQVKHY